MTLYGITIIMVSITVLCFSFSLFRKAAGSMSPLQLNTISYVFYVQIFIGAYFGSILLALGVLDYHYLAQPLSERVKLESWMWMMYSMIAMPVSMLFLNHVTQTDVSKDLKKYIQLPVVVEARERTSRLIVIGMVVFAVLVLAYILYYTDKIPFLTLLLEGDEEQARIDRVSSKLDFQGIDYIKGLLGLTLTPVLCYVAYVYMILKKKLFYVVSFLVLLLLTFVLLTHDIQKAPIAFFALGFLIIQTLVKKGITLRQFLLFTGAAVALILVGYQLTTDKDALDQITTFNSGFYGRIFVSGYMGYPLSMELFPSVIENSTLASGVPGFLRNFFGVENTESARLLMQYVNPEGVRAGSSNLVSGYYMGEAWANYRYAGLIGAPIVVGLVVQTVHIFLLKNSKSPLIIAFYAYVTVKWLIGAGFVTFLFLKIILFPYVLYLIVRLFIGNTKKMKRSNASVVH